MIKQSFSLILLFKIILNMDNNDKWTIENINLSFQEVQGMNLFCYQCKQKLIPVKLIEQFLILTSSKTKQTVHYFVIKASSLHSVETSLLASSQEFYINVTNPLMLMQLGRVRCLSCKLEIGSLVVTVNIPSKKWLKDCILLKVEKMDDSPKTPGLKESIIQNAMEEANERNTIFAQQNREKLVGTKSMKKLLEESFQNINYFSNRLTQIHERLNNIQAVHQFLQKMQQKR